MPIPIMIYGPCYYHSDCSIMMIHLSGGNNSGGSINAGSVDGGFVFRPIFGCVFGVVINCASMDSTCHDGASIDTAFLEDCSLERVSLLSTISHS